MASQAWIEGRIAYLEDREDRENPYLTQEERSQLKDEWNTKARDWDDGWCEAKVEDDEDNTGDWADHETEAERNK